MLKSSINVLLPFLKELFDVIKKIYSVRISHSLAPLRCDYSAQTKDDPDSYRSISLLSTLSKVFTSVLNTRLVKWVDENRHNIVREQAG